MRVYNERDMINRDYLIIGAGLAGVCACEGIREHDKKGSILLVGRELFPPTIVRSYRRNS